MKEEEGNVWKKEEGKIWNDNDCKNVGNLVGNLEFCKDKCYKTRGCTAVAHSVKYNGCTLRACKKPDSPPKRPNADFTGYYMG